MSPWPVSETSISTAAPSSASELLNAEHAEQAALHGLGSVVDQVCQGAADGLMIGENRRETRFKVALDGDALEAAGKQGKCFIGDPIHVAGTRLRRRKLGERGELVDQRAQRANACQNDFAAFANDGGRIGLAAVQVAADTFSGERDGRERILDFVGDALRHFFPRELALGAEKFRSVFDDEDGARSVRARVQDARWSQRDACCGRADGIPSRWRLRPCAGRGG